MEKKVLKAGDFVRYYFIFITSFDSDQKFDLDQLRIKLWAGGGYLSTQRYVPPKRIGCLKKI